jgi:signal transduction histidine kinase
VTPLTSDVGEDQLRLPRPPGLLRGFTTTHPVALDVVAVVVSILVGWVQTDPVGLHGTLWQSLGKWSVVVYVLVSVTLLLRRRHPVVPLLGAAVGALPVLLDDQGPLLVPIVVSVYSFAVYRSTRSAAAAAAVLIIEMLTAQYVTGGALDRTPFFSTVGVVLALLVGTSVGDRRRYLDELIARNAQLAAEQEQRALVEVAAERARITRELHDVVAHGLSVIVRLSDGAEAVAETDPPRAREAVRQVGRVGREALRDMRRMLGVLSGEPAGSDLAPQPSLADLPALIETYRSAGLPVVVERSGGAQLDRATQLVVYRSVQEGLTNALRYAGLPSTVLVRLRLDDVVEVEVSDDGAGLDAGAGHQPSLGSGRGLVGLRERAALYGGSVTAGPRDDLDGRGWRLHLRIDPSTATREGPG